ncbi:MAG TPA: TonB-dependent receptor, partial [Terriglobales bacterium]
HVLKVGADAIHSSSGGFGQEFGSGFLLGQFTLKPGVTKPADQLTIADVQRFQQSFGNSQYNIREWLGSVFAQDNFRLTSNLTVEAGLRYEAQQFTDDHNNVAPRLGIAYKLPDTNTVVRASYGMFYSEIRADLAAGDKLNGPNGIFTFSAAPGQLGFPTSLSALPAFPAGAILPPRDITVRAGQRALLSQFFDVNALPFYPDALLNPYTHQWTAAIEHDFGAGWLFTIDYLGQRSFKLERPLDLNAPSVFLRTAPGQVRSAAVADATRPIVPLPNGFRRIIATVNQGWASYDGLQLEARKRMSRRFTAILGYTYSHTINTVEPDVPQQDPNDNHLLGEFEKANGLLDQRHRVSASGNYALPWGFAVGSWITAGSGRPYNVTTGADNNGDGSNADRPVINGVVIPRNFGQGTPTYDISAYIGKSFRITEGSALSVRAEGYNLTNANNIVGRNGVFGNGATPLASFGQALSGLSNVDPARAFQFQARFVF